jgi:hypothetical protein
MPDVTQILNAIEDGDPSAAEELLPLIYDELRKLAAARMAMEAGSAGRFLGRTAGESLEHRQLELTENRVGDVIMLSNDRRTVSLDLAAPIRFSDLVRVIVDASETPRTGDEL